MTAENKEIRRNPEKNVGQAVATITDLSFASPERILFYDVNLVLKRGENIALIGESGVGKSSLLKIITGKELPVSGKVNIGNNINLSYVPQDLDDLEVEEDATIQEVFYKSRGLYELETKKREIEVKMQQPENSAKINSLIEEYSHVLEKYEKVGAYHADSEMRRILAGLKLDPQSTGHITPETKLNEVSSGQRTRILIGQALFAKSDLLILDDPTSHLDVDSVNWLSKYLRDSAQATLIATNNIPFINATSNRIIEITDFGRTLSFEGNYQEYMNKRTLLIESEKAAAESVIAKRDQLEATLLKFRNAQVFKRSADMAQVGRALESRIGRLDDQLENMPGTKQVDRQQRIRKHIFEEERRSGNDVLELYGPVKKYGDFTALDLHELAISIQRNEKFLISGENGSGKSTLLRMIAESRDNTNNKFSPDEGLIELGANVDLGYYSPDRQGISKKGTIFQEILSSMKNPNEGLATSILLYWGMPKESIRTRKIESLSAGEKKQLALAKLMATKPNLLILDEPTDYLKPDLIDRLINSLEGYKGTLILVSHNREFVNELSLTRELLLPQGEIILHKGIA